MLPPYFDTNRTASGRTQVTDVSSKDNAPVMVDEVSPLLMFAVLAGFWVLIATMGYLAIS